MTSTIAELLRTLLDGFEMTVLAYFLILNSVYLLLTILATIDFSKYLRRSSYAGHEDVFANPMTPGVSIIVPAYNEEAGAVDSVRAMLSMRFPKFEVIMVDDGSTDSTFDRLQANFDLVEVPWSPSSDAIPTMGEILSVHVAQSGVPLTVVRKKNAKSRADATNAGINVSRMPLVCMVDADSLLDPEALLRVVKPFVDDPKRVVATGGVIRPANGCTVERGEVIRTSMPKGWLARIQVVEYLRSFLLGRTGWSVLDSMLVISGAFGLFRRDLILEVGGYDHQSMGEDAEMVAHLHQHLRDQGRRDYRIVFVSEPVCWTEVPETVKILARQRRRWSRGLAEVLWKYRQMMFNPRYGRMGLFVLPYYLFFELLGPIVEVLGFVVVGAAVAVGLVGLAIGVDLWFIDTQFAILFGIVALGYGFFLSVAAIAAEEFSFQRMLTWKDLGISLVASIFENVGYRQMHSWWRLRGLFWWLRRGEANWGAMPRVGFAGAIASSGDATGERP